MLAKIKHRILMVNPLFNISVFQRTVRLVILRYGVPGLERCTNLLHATRTNTNAAQPVINSENGNTR